MALVKSVRTAAAAVVVLIFVLLVAFAGAAPADAASSSHPGATPSPTPTSGVPAVQHHHLTPLSLIVLAGLVLGMLLLTRSIRGRRE